MRILLTNDDGVMAEGIYVLAKELEKEYEVTIVAPETQKSAQSHAITLFQPLEIKEVEVEGLASKAYSVSGTPADCVRAGIEILAEGEIDIVISGTNIGLNAGMDILYSGTVSAAIEGNIYNIPSIAVSAEVIEGKGRFDIAAKYTKSMLKKVKEKILESKIVLNINVPYREEEKDILGLKVCRVGEAIYDYYLMDINEEGHRVLSLNGREKIELEKDTDRYYLKEGYVTVTPLHYDLTNFKLIEDVQSWI